MRFIKTKAKKWRQSAAYTEFMIYESSGLDVVFICPNGDKLYSKSIMAKKSKEMAEQAAATRAAIEKEHVEGLERVQRERDRRAAEKEADMLANGRSGKQGTIYFIQGTKVPLIKIGWSTNFDQRLTDIQSCSPDILEVLVAIKGTYRQEQELHRQFSEHRQHGEWFTAGSDLIEFVKDEQRKRLEDRWGVLGMTGGR